MMDDYKKLIVQSEEWLAITKRLKADGLTQHIEMCADAIEQLVGISEQFKRERDAAIADLKGIVADSEIDIDPCYYCKYVEEDGQCFHECNPFSGKWGWEWRGVKNEICDNHSK